MTAEPKESPSTPVVVAKKLGKMMAVRVQMLDDSITLFQVQVGFELLEFGKKLLFVIGSYLVPMYPQGIRGEIIKGRWMSYK